MKEKRKRSSRRWVDWGAASVMTVWAIIVVALIAFDITRVDIVCSVITLGFGLVMFSVFAIMYKGTLS